MKWVRDNDYSRDVTRETIREQEEEEVYDAEKENKKYQGFDDELILLLTRKKHLQPSHPKYVFLTEKDARVKGKFTDKFRDQFDNKDIPKPFDGAKIPLEKAKSVMGMTSAEDTYGN